MHIFSIMHFLEKETEADTCMYESATGVVCKRGIFYGFLHFYFGLLELHIGGDVQCGFGAYSVAVTEVHPRIQTAEVFLAQCHTISQSDTCYRAVLLLQKGNTYRQLNRQKYPMPPPKKIRLPSISCEPTNRFAPKCPPTVSAGMNVAPPASSKRTETFLEEVTEETVSAWG